MSKKELESQRQR